MYGMEDVWGILTHQQIKNATDQRTRRIEVERKEAQSRPLACAHVHLAMACAKSNDPR